MPSGLCARNKYPQVRRSCFRGDYSSSARAFLQSAKFQMLNDVRKVLQVGGAVWVYRMLRRQAGTGHPMAVEQLERSLPSRPWTTAQFPPEPRPKNSSTKQHPVLAVEFLGYQQGRECVRSWRYRRSGNKPAQLRRHRAARAHAHRARRPRYKCIRSCLRGAP